MHALLRHNEQELNRRITQLEILGELRSVQQIIFEEEQNMPITYNLEKDIRYNQGLEKGIEKGIETASLERNTTIVKNMLQHTDHTAEEIAYIVQVSVEFVQNIRKSLLST